MKFILPFLLLTSLFANMTQIEQFYQLSLNQTENNQFIIHDDHLLFPHPYVKKLRFKATSSLQGAEVIYFGKIGNFNELSDWGGVHIHTVDKTYLQFNLRYYEHLQDIGEGGSFYAICDLPTYTNCILLGCENNPDDENCY